MGRDGDADMLRKPSKKISKSLLKECQEKLLEAREANKRALQEMKNDLVKDSSSDPADMARDSQELQLNVAKTRFLSDELYEIEEALRRIKSDRYGVCEETGQLIEPSRLRALPWTRLSLEGAEMRAAEAELDQQLQA